MCQLNAVLQRNGKTETVMDAVTGLEVDNHQITLTTFFDEPKTLDNVMIRRIDFLGGSIILEPIATSEHS